MQARSEKLDVRIGFRPGREGQCGSQALEIDAPAGVAVEPAVGGNALHIEGAGIIDGIRTEQGTVALDQVAKLTITGVIIANTAAHADEEGIPDIGVQSDKGREPP